MNYDRLPQLLPGIKVREGCQGWVATNAALNGRFEFDVRLPYILTYALSFKKQRPRSSHVFNGPADMPTNRLRAQGRI